jgi:hypothetical protein
LPASRTERASVDDLNGIRVTMVSHDDTRATVELQLTPTCIRCSSIDRRAGFVAGRTGRQRCHVYRNGHESGFVRLRPGVVFARRECPKRVEHVDIAGRRVARSWTGQRL